MESFFRSVLTAINDIVGNYGIAVILFTLLIRLVVAPFDFKSRKSMRRMEKLNPQLQALQKKYANDKEKLQKKQAELYKKEKINPLGSCLPVLLTFPILFIMFGAMRGVANERMVDSLRTLQAAVGTLTEPAAVEAALPAWESLTEPFLWVKSLWMADSPFVTVLPSSSSDLLALGKEIAGVITEAEMTALHSFVDSELYQTIVLPHYGATIMPGATVNLLIAQLQIYRLPNGFFILPILAFITQFFSNSLNPQPQTGQNSAGGGGFMKWFFPLFSVYICATSNAAFSLYWVAVNIVMMIQQFLFRKYFEAQDRKAASVMEVSTP